MKYLQQLAALAAIVLPLALASCGGDSHDSEERPSSVSYTVHTGNTQGFSTEELNTFVYVANVYQHAVDSVKSSSSTRPPTTRR